MTHSLASKHQERLRLLSVKENTQLALVLVMSLAAVTKIDDKRRLERQWKEGGVTWAPSSTGYSPGWLRRHVQAQRQSCEGGSHCVQSVEADRLILVSCLPSPCIQYQTPGQEVGPLTLRVGSLHPSESNLETPT